MKLTKQQWIYVGVGVFVFLVLLNSLKKVELKEVSDPVAEGFDSSKLPPELMPPKRAEGDEAETRPIKKNLSMIGINIKPRFDSYF